MLNRFFCTMLLPVSAFKKVLFLALFCLILLSCAKRGDLDALNVKISDGTVSYVEGGDLIWLNGKSYNFTNNKIGVAIQLKEQVKAADTVIASIEPTLVDAYNKLHLENNPAIPVGAFDVPNDGVFPVMTGASSAADSLYVLMNNGALLKDQTVYLVPVKLSSKKGGKLKYTVFYFKIMVKTGELRAKLDYATVFNGTTPFRLSGGAFNLIYINAFPNTLSFSVELNAKFPPHDVDVEATFLSDKQVDSVIVAQKFTGKPFPSDTYSFAKAVIKVGANTKKSKDSIIVSFKNRANFTKFQYYVLGIKLKHYKQSDYGIQPVANDSANAYIRLFLL